MTQRIVGAAFGDPQIELTHSGMPKYLFKAMSKRADIVAYLSTKQPRPWDVFGGVVDLSRIFKHGRLGISRKWLWRRKTVDLLTKRFNRLLKRVGRFDVLIQEGTHARLELEGVKHYCIVDMTLAQGIRNGVFNLEKIKGSLAEEGIETQKSIYENCAGIFVASNWVLKSLVHDYGIKRDKIFVTGLGGALECDVDIQNKRPNLNILFMGRDWRIKGGPMAFEAFKRISESEPKAKLTIIGCSPPISHPAVRILGYLDKTNPAHQRIMLEALDEATVLCVPSPFDCFGFCYVEAQYHGVVPVTFAGQGRNEAIKDGVTGILVKEQNAEVLSEAVLSLLRDRDRTRKMSIAGYRYARQHLTWDRVADDILKVTAGPCRAVSG